MGILFPYKLLESNKKPFQIFNSLKKRKVKTTTLLILTIRAERRAGNRAGNRAAMLRVCNCVTIIKDLHNR